MNFATTTKSPPAFRLEPGAPLPPLERLALLLDLDGTLLDIAAAPDDVVVPSSLPDLLTRLRRRLAGALAIVTGRTIESVTKLFPSPDFIIVGEHGAVLRRRDGTIENLARALVPARWRTDLARLVASADGLLLEAKPHGLVLHYRNAPDRAGVAERAVRAVVAEHEDDFVVQPARMAWEIRPRGVDKGTAVRTLLGRGPFVGRVPVFVGDDTTDLDGIRAARAADGFGFEVGTTFGNAPGVRAWLATLLERPERAERGV